MELFIFLLIFAVGFTSAIETYYMDSQCGGGINMISDGINQGKLVLEGPYVGDCNVTIETWYIADKLMFYFENFNLPLPVFGGCQDQFLTAYDGQDPQYAPVMHGLNKICGTELPTQTNGFTTKYRYVTFRYKNTDPTLDAQFSIVFTAFHNGYCYSYEYECDNGRCIDDEINCGDYNPCGDYSDCKLSGWAIAGIVAGAVFALTTTAVIVFIIYRNRNRPLAQRGQIVSVQPGQAQAAVVSGVPNYGIGNQYSATYSTPITTTSVQK